MQCLNPWAAFVTFFHLIFVFSSIHKAQFNRISYIPLKAQSQLMRKYQRQIDTCDYFTQHINKVSMSTKNSAMANKSVWF